MAFVAERVGAAPAPKARAEAPRRAAATATPRVSIVTPAFNAAATLGRTIGSVRAQTIRDWELIVVDDGSADATADIAARRASRDPRIRLVRQANGGASAARNRGVAEARGEWLLFLDSDDWLSRTALADLIATAEANPHAGVAVGRTRRIDAGGRGHTSWAGDLSDAFQVLACECRFGVHSALVRADLVRAAGGFDETLKTAEDWDLWQRIARTGAAFVQTPKLVAFYRNRPGSLSKDLGRLARDGVVVLRRGHAPDPRVAAADPAYAEGAPANALASRQLFYVLWAAACEIGAGGDAAWAPELLAGLDVDAEPESLGALMAIGVRNGQGSAGPAGWSQMAPCLRDLLEAALPGEARGRMRDLTLATLKARVGGRPLDAVALPELAPRSPRSRAEATVAQARTLPLGRSLTALSPWTSPAFWAAAARALDLRGSGIGGQRRNPAALKAILRHRLRHALASGVQAAVAGRLARDLADASPCAHGQALAAMQADAEARFPRRPPAQAAEARVGRPDEAASAEAWEAFYGVDDPWNYGGSEYERIKYQQTLELIGPDRPKKALELACAEGHFTRALVDRVDHLTATDISATAVARAARRCEGRGEFRPLDFMSDALPGTYDLIVCSEVLYYAGERLPAVARKLADGLEPGGLLVMAHANQISDEPEATGFDWGEDYGSKTIAAAFEAVPDLVLEREIATPLYRVQAFRKRTPGVEPAPTQRETRPVEARLDLTLSKNIVWGGGESRIGCSRRERATDVPILMYHRVAPDGPEALARYRVAPEAFAEQVAWLRRHGYWGVTPAELAEAVRRNRPLPGRPVMLTFDDGYVDFADHAWPVLQEAGFAATLFVVAGRAGQTSDWDAAHGAPAPLLGWDRLAALAVEGVAIESHGFSHRPLGRLPMEDVYREAVDSRAAIAAHVGEAPTAFCYPYGSQDPAVLQAVREAGYELGFATDHAVATLASDPHRLPRIEVAGADTIESFARKLGRR